MMPRAMSMAMAMAMATEEDYYDQKKEAAKKK